jgi:hypothetical protein
LGGETAVRTEWAVVGLGAVAGVVGVIMWSLHWHAGLGLILGVGGVVVAVIGIIMRLVMAFVSDKGELR